MIMSNEKIPMLMITDISIPLMCVTRYDFSCFATSFCLWLDSGCEPSDQESTCK